MEYICVHITDDDRISEFEYEMIFLILDAKVGQIVTIYPLAYNLKTVLEVRSGATTKIQITITLLEGNFSISKR